MKFTIQHEPRRKNYFWELTAGNGEKVASSPPYTRKANCLRQMHKLARAFREADMAEVEDNTPSQIRGRKPKVVS